MPTNIEIKAAIESVDKLLPRAAAVAGDTRVDITQDDTFFACEHGRLKLRTRDSRRGELIFYRRADRRGPKPSFYTSTTTTDPDGLRRVLDFAYGSVGRVRKHRIVYKLEGTLIHLDRVEGLGDFLELEVALHGGQPIQAGIAEAHRVLQLLGVGTERLVEGAYIDLLSAMVERQPL